MFEQITSMTGDQLWIVWALTTIICITAAGVLVTFMASESDSFLEWATERIFRAKAKAEEKALEKAGNDKVQGFLKDQLKKNPVVSKEELNGISSGLGDEATKDFEKFGKGLGNRTIFTAES